MDIVSECRGGVFIKLVHARLGCHTWRIMGLSK